MALDPNYEDFQRLSLRFAGTLGASDPFGAARAAVDFGHRYSQKRDTLPQTDEDRAFHLVARATELIDYQLPFATDASAIVWGAEARKLLGEALELDPECHDARRMLSAAQAPTPNEYHRFLVEGGQEVLESCGRRRDAITGSDEVADVARTLAMRPYLRWLAAECASSLICGRYRLTLKEGEEALAVEPEDPADVSLTLALTYAKLEDEEGLRALCERADERRGPAWYALARAALAFKREDRDEARAHIARLLALYPNAGTTLARQDDLPDGVFARLAIDPGTEDELILATSEATVLLQEGCDSHERGTFGWWVANLPEVTQAQARELAADPSLGEGQK